MIHSWVRVKDMTKAHLSFIFIHVTFVRMVFSNTAAGQPGTSQIWLLLVSNRRKPSAEAGSVATGTRSKTSQPGQAGTCMVSFGTF
jgi:hypothetical protein